MPLDPDRLRGWVYDALVRPKREVGANTGGLQLADISRWVKQKAQQAGFMPHDTLIGTNDLEEIDKNSGFSARSGGLATMRDILREEVSSGERLMRFSSFSFLFTPGARTRSWIG